MGMILGGSKDGFFPSAVVGTDDADRGAWGTRIVLSVATVSGHMPEGNRFSGYPRGLNEEQRLKAAYRPDPWITAKR